MPSRENCSDECEKDHRPQHKKECKKRVAELHDELLFKQPESSHIGDCPICCLPLSIDDEQSIWNSCCCKLICTGCNLSNKKREIKERLQHKCPFCRKAVPDTEEQVNEQLMKRIEANDPVAISHMGMIKCHEGDYNSALEYWTKAAAFGCVEAHYELSVMYDEGEGVEKDEKKEVFHSHHQMHSMLKDVHTLVMK